MIHVERVSERLWDIRTRELRQGEKRERAGSSRSIDILFFRLVWRPYAMSSTSIYKLSPFSFSTVFLVGRALFFKIAMVALLQKVNKLLNLPVPFKIRWGGSSSKGSQRPRRCIFVFLSILYCYDVKPSNERALRFALYRSEIQSI